jgi:hypothetical protein
MSIFALQSSRLIDTPQTYYITLLGTDHLELFFGLVQTSVSPEQQH